MANGARGWDLVGYIVLGTCSGIIAGGVIAATIFTGGAAMNLGYEMFKTGLAVLAGGGGGTAGGALAVAGVGVMAAGSVVVVGGTAVGLQIGVNVMFSKLPMHEGPPNGTLSNNTSIGNYDSDGNLIERTDFKGKPHFIKELGKKYLPHTHHYRWRFNDGIWQKIMEWVTP